MKMHRLMLRGLRVFGLLAVALAATSGEADAQRRGLPPDPRDVLRPPPTEGEEREGRFYLEVRAGVGQPVADFGAASGAGVSVGAGVGKWVFPQLAGRIRADIDLPGTARIEEGPNAGAEGPGWLVMHFDAGVSYDVTQGSGPVLFAFDFGLGATLIDSDEFQTRQVSGWYFTATPGVAFGIALGTGATFLVDGRYRAMFGDKGALDPILRAGDSTFGYVQLQAGLRFLVGR